MALDWFEREVRQRTQWCDFPPLVTTCTDGDNGGWFRNPEPEANFWGFYRGLLEQARAGSDIRPTFIEDYLNEYGPHGEVIVHQGAWNTGWHHGHDFLQWTGSQAQKEAFERLTDISQAIHDLRWHLGELHHPDLHLDWEAEQAMWRLLRAETSCNFYWGEAWTDRVHRDINDAWWHLHQARTAMDTASPALDNEPTGNRRP
jgi:alpha-amylase/alpha-mannosidase (GH57 family)